MSASLAPNTASPHPLRQTPPPGRLAIPEPSRFIDEMPQADLKILGRKGGEPIVSHEEGKANLRSMLDMLNAKMGQGK